MEAAGECLVCGITEIQRDQPNNVALLSVLTAVLGCDLGLAPLSTYTLCQRCWHLLSEAATLQEKLDQVKDAILSVYRPVQYHRSISTQLPNASTALPASAHPAIPSSTATIAGHLPTQEQVTETHSMTGASVVPAKITRTGLESLSLSSNSTVIVSAPTSAVAVPGLKTEETGTKTETVTKVETAKRLPCPVCGKSVTARYLRAHQRQHSGERPFSCPLCPRSFTKSSDLTMHRRRHAGDRRHQCSVCPAAFFFPHELALHKHKHSETRPYLCTECGTGFFSRAGLLRHQRVNHSDQRVDQSAPGVDSHRGDSQQENSQREDPYNQNKCGQCGKSFVCERSLRRHVRAHGAGKRYMCEGCGVTYRSSTALRFHTKQHHSGERPYQCEICGRQFVTRSVWLRHLRVHTGETPFRCQFCGTEYKDKQKLKRHYSNKHAADVAKVGAENLKYTVGTASGAAVTKTMTDIAREGTDARLSGPPQSLSATVETCAVNGLDPGRVMPDLEQGQAQAQVSGPGWSQQWKEAVSIEQAYGDASAAVAARESCSAIQPREITPVEMMQESSILPQGMLYEAQSALFSYF